MDEPIVYLLLNYPIGSSLVRQESHVQRR